MADLVAGIEEVAGLPRVPGTESSCIGGHVQHEVDAVEHRIQSGACRQVDAGAP
jgi:hypothetical protein